MKIILSLMLSLTSLTAFAETKTPAPANYNVKLELAVDGKHVASRSMEVNANEKAVISQKAEGGVTYVIEVLLRPEEAKKKVVKMNFTVSRESAEGVREVIATPQVIAKERKGATITVNKSDGSEALSLKVWAKKNKENTKSKK